MRKKSPKLYGMLAGLAILQGVIHQGIVYPNWKENYAPLSGGDMQGLSADQLLFAFAGFRELIAGILWVKADSFFDERRMNMRPWPRRAGDEERVGPKQSVDSDSG